MRETKEIKENCVVIDFLGGFKPFNLFNLFNFLANLGVTRDTHKSG